MAKNKKGSILDLIFIGIILLVFSVAVLIVFKVSNSMNTEIQATDIDADAKAAFANVNGIYSGVLDNMFAFLMVGLAIGAFVLASLVRIHPAFFIFYFIVLVIIIFLSGIFSNIYLEMANSADMIDVAEKLTMISWGMWALPWLVGVFGSLLAIIMYKNYREAEG